MEFTRWIEAINPIVTLLVPILLLIVFAATRDVIFATKRISEKLETESSDELSDDPFIIQGPKTFYYLDESQITGLYQQISEPDPDSIETTVSKGRKGTIGAVLGWLGLGYEQSSGQEIKKKYSKEDSASLKFNALEDYFFHNEMITTDIMDFDPDPGTPELLGVIDKAEEYYGEIPKDITAALISGLNAERAEQCAERVSRTSGWVAVKDEFLVERFDESGLVLSHTHMAGVFISAHRSGRVFSEVPDGQPGPSHASPPAESQQVFPEMTIKLVGSHESVSKRGASAFVPGKKLKISCIGKVTAWDDIEEVLEINPLGVF